MISDFNPFGGDPTWFQALNILLASATSVILIVTFLKARFLFIKPSIWLFASCHVFMQWPVAVYSVYYQFWLPQPYELLALVHGTVIVGLLISLIIFRPTARLAWSRLDTRGSWGAGGSSAGYAKPPSEVLAVVALMLLFVLAIGTYLAEIPFRCTGLYSLAAAPEAFPLAREVSLKLIQPSVPRYALTLVSSAIAPLLTGILVVHMIRGGSTSRQVRAVLVGAAILLPVWMLADLTGAKGVLVALSLVVAFTFLWWRRLSVNPIVAGLVIGCSLLPAILIMTVIGAAPFQQQGSYDINRCLSVVGIPLPDASEQAAKDGGVAGGLAGDSLRRDEADSRSAEDLAKDTAARKATEEQRAAMIDALIIKPSETIGPKAGPSAQAVDEQSSRYLNVLRDNLLPIVYRAAVVPLQTGGWFVHYQQTQGAIGVGGVAKLARLLKVPFVDAPNLIGQTYGPIYYGHPVSPTISAGASFIFANYLFFGLPAILVNIAMILLIDVALFVFVRIDSLLLVPLLGALTPVSLKFIESEYPTVWLTHGYGVMLLLALGITWLLRFQSRRAAVLNNG